MKKFSKSAFVALLALVCYAGFVSAQVVSFDNSGDLGNLVTELKAGNHPGFGGGHGDHNPQPTPFQPPHNGGDHNGPGHNDGPFNPGPGHHDGPFNPGPGHHDGPFNPGPQPGPHPGPWNPGPHPGPWNPGPQPGPHPGPWNPGPQPDPWHPGPQPDPWHPGPQPGPHPGPQPGQWHPHHPGHPDWNNNDWGHNGWNNHGPNNNGWWNNYDAWWMNNNHPYSQYRTVCEVVPGVSAKGFIVENTMPFYGKATFYYYDAFNNLISASNTANSVYTGGNGTPIFDFYQVPGQADRCFLAVSQN